MPKVKLTTPLGGHNAGEVIEVTQGSAHKLISENYAESVDATKPRSKPKTKDTPDPGEDDDTDRGGASPGSASKTVG